MNEDQATPSLKDRIKPRLRSAAKYATTGVAGGVVAVYAYKQRTAGITFCSVTLEQIAKMHEQGQGVIVFGKDTLNPIWFALPDKV